MKLFQNRINMPLNWPITVLGFMEEACRGSWKKRARREPCKIQDEV